MVSRIVVAFLLGIVVADAWASSESNGPNGIMSVGLRDFDGALLSGQGIDIGQVEATRTGKSTTDTDVNCCEPSTIPEQVYFLDHVAAANEGLTINFHPMWVAGVMISTDTTARGAATGANLHASAFSGTLNFQSDAAVSAQHLAEVVDVSAINMSFGVPLEVASLNGNSLLTAFIDWSASQHDVLYVVAGNEGGNIPVPTDEFNGMTVAASRKNATDGVFRQVALTNDGSMDAAGNRTSIDILAPGVPIDLIGPNGNAVTDSGTSFAAPHVTATAALLHEYAAERINDGGWNAFSSRRHEVMKAVMMNSADKLKDAGDGLRLGMDRTVVKKNTLDTWLDSDAFTNDMIPLDEQMGTGHLNAKRAVQQFAAGEHEFNAGTVPLVGWDYGLTDGQDEFNKYILDSPLPANQFVSLTLAWDRDVFFEIDDGTPGEFDPGDTFLDFAEPVDLNLYLMPAGQTNVNQAVARSIATDTSVEHIFFEITTPGMYEIWVGQDSGGFSQQLYALAWWMEAIANPASTGDYSGNGTVGPEDYTIWKSNFGTSFAAADGNGDGIVDAADYTIWRDHLGQMVGSGSLASVPEPSVWLMLVGVAAIARRKRSASARSA